MCLLLRCGLILVIVKVVANLSSHGGRSRGGTVEAMSDLGTGRMEIQGPNVFFVEQPPYRVTVFDGKDHFLKCRLNLENVTQTLWFKDGHKVSGGRDGTLRLSGNKNSAGVYRCLVNQTYLSTSSHVAYPVFLRNPQVEKSRIAVEGSHIILDCPFTSVPEANITWMFDESGNFPDNRFLKLTNGSLLIKNIKPANSGKYKCKAENLYATSKNKTHRQFNYMITVKPSELNNINNNNKHLLPILQQTVQYIPFGGQLRLQCDSHSSEPDGKIKWTLWRTENGRKVVTPNNFKLENSNRSLIVGNLTNAHYGNYTCQNEYGEQTFTIYRQQKPTIVTPVKSIACNLNAIISLTCEAIGNPKPEISWFRNGVLLSNNYTVNITENELKIYSFDVSDEGMYQCFVQNSAGEAQSIGEIRLTDEIRYKLDTLPKPLIHIKCSPLDLKTLNISFETPSIPDDIIMGKTFPWDVSYIKNREIHRLPLNRRYFISDVEKSRQFSVFTVLLRVATTTSLQVHLDHSKAEMMTSSFSEPFQCSTQGIPISQWNDRFMIHWKSYDIPNIESFVVQILLLNNYILSTTKFEGITNSSNEILEISEKSDEVLKENLASKHIYTLIFPADVRGLAFPDPRIDELHIRVLVITEDNKHLMTGDNLHYLSWTKVKRKYLFVDSISSKSVIFQTMKDFNGSFCINVCHFEVMLREPLCEEKVIMKGESLIYNNLKSKTDHQFNFFNCTTGNLIDEIRIRTSVDKPAIVKNCQIVEKDGGILITWASIHDQDVLGYKIRWTIDNESQEKSIPRNIDKFFIQNVSNNNNFQISIYVNGTSGFSDPIHLSNKNLDSEFRSVDLGNNSKLPFWSAIVLGVALSLICIVVFISIACCMKNYYKSSAIHQQSETQPSLSGKAPKNEFQERQILIPSQTSVIPISTTTANGMKPRKSSIPISKRYPNSKEQMWDCYQEENQELQTPLPPNGYHFEMMANSVIVPPNRQHLDEIVSQKPVSGTDIPINNNNNSTSPILHIHSNGHQHNGQNHNHSQVQNNEQGTEQDSTMTTDISDLTVASSNWTPNHRSFVESTC